MEHTTRHPHAQESSRSASVARTVWDWRNAANAALAAADRAHRAAAGRKSGLVRAAIGFAIALLLAWWKPAVGVVAGALSLAILLLALISPLGAYAALARGLERFGHGVGLAVTWVLMGLVFYLVFVPLGLVLRLAGKLGIRRGAEPERATYWEPVDWEGTVSRSAPETYRRQF